MKQTLSALRMFETRIDVPAEARLALTSMLNQRLADMTDLYNQTKYAHWNVKGRDFIQLHELFDRVADHVEEACDLIAERVTTLGGVAEGTTRQVAEKSVIDEYDLFAVDGADHVRALATQMAKVAMFVRTDIGRSAESDPTTADLLTEISRSLDKDLWFLEAHLQTGQDYK